MILSAVMTEVANRLRTLGIEVRAYPSDRVNPPEAVIIAPDSYTFDETYKRGLDRMNLPVLLLMARIDDRSSWETLAMFCDGNGAKSVKRVLEESPYETFDCVSVTDIEFDVVRWNNVDYLSAKFNLDIEGS